MVFTEAKIVSDRLNLQMATTISLMQLALSTIPNQSVKPAQTKKTARELTKLLKELRDG